MVLLLSGMSRPLGALSARIGARPLLVAGPLLSALGFALLAVPSIGRPYWKTYLPGATVLGLGMGTTVAPLTAAVMGAVEPRHAGAASGINNAIARAAGLLAVAALGVVLVARFDADLDSGLAAMHLPADIVQVVDAQRSKLAAADLSSVTDPATREAIHRVLGAAYVSAFRTLMLSCACLAALGAVAAYAFVGRKARA